jgi:2-oxoglutarate/2-oxoacid ferredoxin oxidoreductase subunit beta
MEKRTANDYKSNVKPSWCPGCGDYAVLAALTSVMAELNYDPDETAIVSGIGCSSRLPFFTKTYGFHTIHGRALPISIGLKASNPALNVITIGGDGDGFSIGGNHFIHAARKNPNITYIVMDNEIYALTKGQTSPTSHSGLRTKINPYENMDDRINPVLMALSFETSFVARSFSGDIPQLKKLIKAGMEHKGFSFIHVLSPCIHFNDKITFKTLKQKIVPLPEDHDTSNLVGAMDYTFRQGHYYTGLLYQKEKPTHEERLEKVIEICRKDSSINEKQILNEIMMQFA